METITRPNFRERCQQECTRDVVFLFQVRRLQWSGHIPDGWELDSTGDRAELVANDEGDTPEGATLTIEAAFKAGLSAGEFDIPVVLEEWRTDGVYLSRKEAESHGNAKHYNYPDGWRVYGVPSHGELAELIKGT